MLLIFRNDGRWTMVLFEIHDKIRIYLQKNKYESYKSYFA